MATEAEAKEIAAKSDITDHKAYKIDGFPQGRGTPNLPRPPPPPETLPPPKDGIDVEDDEVKGAKSKSTEDAMKVETLADLPPIPADAGNRAASPDASAIASGEDDDGDGSSSPRDGTPNSSAAVGSDAATIAAASPNANDNGDASAPGTELQEWFLDHALPYDEDVAGALDDWGVECVEQLKMLPREYFVAMFDGHKFIVKETAKLAFEEIRAVPVDLKRCALNRLRPGPGSAPSASRNRKEGTGKLSPKKKTQQVKSNLGLGRPTAKEENVLSPPRPFEGQTPPSKPRRHRSNWALDPRLAAAVQEWFDEGPPLNVRGKPMSKREFARMKGIPRSSFVIYTHKDPSKRRTLGTPIGRYSSDILYQVFVKDGQDLTPVQLEDKILALEPKLTRKEAQYHCRKLKQRHGIELKAQSVPSPSAKVKDEPTTGNLEV